MKRIIGIAITLIIILTGCSGVKNDSGKTAASNTSPINKEQAQLQPENSVKNTEAADSNAPSDLLDNIDTSKSPFEKGYYDYQGTINNNLPIHMSIYPLETDMVGTYFYDSKRTEIKLKGKAGAKDFVLYEYDENGKNTGIFKGTISSVDKIQGTWTGTDGKQSYPFTLSLQSSIPGAQYGKRYAVAVNSQSDMDVEIFAGKIQIYVINGNKEQLAELISYPITAKVSGKTTKIQNKADFIKNYDQIFSSAYKLAISKAYTKYLFVNSKGIMFGENLYNLWINESSSKLTVTAINN